MAGRFVAPDDDSAAVAVFKGVGFQEGLFADIGEFGIFDVGIVALIVATDEDSSAAVDSGDVDFGAVEDADFLTEDVDGSSGSI